jgi:glycosyltransferase involved in cell wall biosynthesis
VDIAISSLRMVRDEIADVRVFFVGGSSLDVERYRELARRYGVERHVKFYGYVADEDEAQDILVGSMAGLALYKPVKDNMSLYTDSSKVKTYISAGLPVLITREGPEISRDIEGFGAGLLVDYDEADIAKNIIRILKDADLHSRLKQGVAKFGEAYDYKQLGGDIWGQISGRLKL